MFAGFVTLGETPKGAFSGKNSQESPFNADPPPTFKVYGPDGLMRGGTGIATKLDSDASLYQYAVAADPSNGYAMVTSYRVFVTAVVLGLTVTYEQSFNVS